MAPGGRAHGLPHGRLSGCMKVARLHGRQVGGGGGGGGGGGEWCC